MSDNAEASNEQAPKRLVVGVTGAPGSGKTSAAGALRRLGARALALDKLGHKLLREDPVRRQVKDTVSTGVLRIMGGQVSRTKRASVVFSDPRELEKLNRILHPKMVARVEEDLAAWRESADAAPVFVVEGALLIEMGLADRCGHVVLVRSPLEQRLERLRRTRGWGEDDLFQRENAQMGDDERLKRADVVVDNDSSLNELDRKMEAFWEEWT